MKTYLLLICSCLILSQSNAQNFAPIGAKWHYSIGGLDFYGVKCAVLTVKEDTLINNITASVIEVKLIDNPGIEKVISHEYIARQNDSVMYYNPNYNQFFLLYNFSARAGDTIHVHKNLSKVTPAFLVPRFAKDSIIFSYRVISTDSVIINGTWKKKQTIASLSNSYYTMTTYGTDSFNVVIDGFYSFTYLFGRAALITMETPGNMLRCYNDSTLSFKYAKWEKDCDYVNPNSGISQATITQSIQVFPNPVNQTLNIKQESEKYKQIAIYNISGQLMLKQNLNTLETILNVDVNTLTPGIYYCELQTVNSGLVRSKFIKQ